MLKIFAKIGTDEKIAVFCKLADVQFLNNRFKEKYGGNWVMVDECHTSTEGLKFNDGQEYKGFEAEQPHDFRYSRAIVNL